MNFDRGFSPCDIYLPARPVDLTRWAVIACDQYTSQRDYWDKVSDFVGDEPSSLELIQPEIDLATAGERLSLIRERMRTYLRDGILMQQVTDGFIVTLRHTSSGPRPGLIGKVDLEAYDFTPGNDRPVRASEGTILERIPPRMRIRRGAQLELPHIMLLADDPQGILVESAYEHVKDRAPLYDFELMMNGGHLTGWAVEDDALKSRIDAALDKLYSGGEGMLFAVGDGNHSLATAKAYWEEVKKDLSPAEAKNHPARYALVEVVNIHCPALSFRPIHRVVFGADALTLRDEFAAWLCRKGLGLEAGNDIEFLDVGAYRMKGAENVLPTVYLQAFLDDYLAANPDKSIDYVHGDEAVEEICRNRKAAGIRLGTIDKAALFPSVKLNGVLPRKSFSMGEADEKRFYMEARRIVC